MQDFFFQKMEVGPLELEKGLKAGSPKLKCCLKKGVLRAAHPRTTFQCECPPPGTLDTLIIIVDIVQCYTFGKLL